MAGLLIPLNQLHLIDQAASPNHSEYSDFKNCFSSMNALINSVFLNNCSGMLGEQLSFPHCETLLPQTDGFYDSISFVCTYSFILSI